MAPDWVIAQVRKLVDAGYQEVVLCGTHLGTYGRDLGAAVNFPGLLGRILEETAVRRVRLSSIEPMEFDAGLREAIVSSERICRHLHIPLQSGCDDVLKAMNRGYSTSDYTELIEWFKARCPAMCIGADVIVGFPAESESRFEETLEFIRGIDLSYLHVFSYSVRPGTPAARDYSADEQVPPEEIKRRSRTLRAESRRKRLAFHQTLLRTRLDVLVLKRTDEATGRRLALSDNYVNVLVNADQSLAGRIIPARIVAVSEDAVTAELVP
jgi:threonylcarbamoyladenosine tRNA methylthiotransferase MtaB